MSFYRGISERTDGVGPTGPVSRLYRALRRWSDCQVSRTAFGAGRRRLANFGILRSISELPSNEAPSAFNAPGGLPDDPSRPQPDAIPGAVAVGALSTDVKKLGGH